MNDLIRATLLIFGFNLALVAFFVVLNALFPRRIARTKMVADAMPGRAFAVGLVNFLFFGAITFILFTLVGQVGNELLKVILALPALFFLSALSVGLSFGLAGMVQLVGERLAANQTEIRRTIWGALALSFGSSLPFVGWFGLLPYAGLMGLGALIVSFFWRERSAEVRPQAT
ncbi:MAG: hypothetical protein HYZ49_20415 [Chloroflexi bacterium]|nr:hypothetical protein [Chloroflexota bacterium]